MIPQKLRKISIFLFLIMSVISFNNCTSQSDKVSTESPLGVISPSNSVDTHQLHEDQGDSGYDGKVTYVSRAPENQVCQDGQLIQSAIEVSAQGSAAVVRENCTNLDSARSVTLKEMNLMPHNLDNAVLTAQVFDVLSEATDPTSVDSVYTKYMCRGKYPNKRTGEVQVADVTIKYKTGSTMAESARVIMAVYDSNNQLKSTLDSGELPLRNITTEVVGRVKYVTGIVGLHSITLWIDKLSTNPTGKLSFVDLPYVGRDKELDYNYRDYERVIQSLQCFGN